MDGQTLLFLAPTVVPGGGRRRLRLQAGHGPVALVAGPGSRTRTSSPRRDHDGTDDQHPTADQEGRGHATDADHDRTDRRSDDPGRVQRQVDEVERRRASVRGYVRREHPEDHGADGGGGGREDDRQAGQGGHGRNEGHRREDRTAARKGGDQDRSEPDAIAEHATERSDQPPDEGRRAHHQRDRRRETGTGPDQVLDDDGQVWTTHLGRQERHAEDQRRSAGRPDRPARCAARRTRGRAPAPPGPPTVGPLAIRPQRAAPSRPRRRPTARTRPVASSPDRR